MAAATHVSEHQSLCVAVEIADDSTELPRTTRPFHAIPFPRDPDFVDRGTILDELREKFSVPMSRVALVGIGGVG